MRKYQTEEERKEVKRARYKQWYQENKENKLEQHKYWTKNTQMGRASNLVNAYKQKDKKANRGECTLTAKWVVENIFTKPCAHCGKSGWQIIGCNRLDNSRPHTEDNVEPCCKDCNDKLATEEKTKQVYQYTKEGELVKVWESAQECGRNGYSQGNVFECCNGKRNTHKGFKWSYELIEKGLGGSDTL